MKHAQQIRRRKFPFWSYTLDWILWIATLLLVSHGGSEERCICRANSTFSILAKKKNRNPAMRLELTTFGSTAYLFFFFLNVLFLFPTQFEKVKDYKKTYKNNQSVLGKIHCVLVSRVTSSPNVDSTMLLFRTLYTYACG